ncbi:MAG TPA: hypothetical protein VMV94_02980 [Phycisphaerae bacterium]|nr:hypothetical protein [Phycisphaerae bacterium]
MKPRCLPTLALLCVASTSIAQNAIQIAERAPRDSLLVIAWSGADEAREGFDQSHLGEFWAQPSVQSFVQTPLSSGWAIAKKKLAADVGDAEFDLIEQLGPILWHQPGLVYVLRVEPDKSHPATLGLAIEWDIDKKARQLSRKVIALIKAKLGADAKVLKLGDTTFRRLHKNMPVYLAMKKDRWLLVIGKNTAKKVLEDRGGDMSFADNPCHKRALKAIGKVSPWYYYIVDVAGLRAAVLTSISSYAKKEAEDENAAGSTAPAMTAAAVALLVQTVLVGDAATLGSGEFAIACEFDGQQLRKSAYAKTDAKHPIICDFAGHKPLDLKRLSDVPADAVSCQILTFDAATAYSQTLQTVEWYAQEIGKRSSEDKPLPIELAAKIRSVIGLDIEKDLLSHLGDHLIWLSAGSPRASYILGAIDVRDRAAVESFIESVIKKLPPETQIQKQEIEGATAYLVSLGKGGPLTLGEICLALTDDRLIVCSNRAAATTFIAHLGKPIDERKTIAERPALRKFLKEHQGERISWIQWENEAKGFEIAYPQLAMLYAMAAAAKHASDLPIELGELPPPADFTSHMAETVSWTVVEGPVRIRRDNSGLGLGSALTSTSKIALGIAVALPALARARETAKRTVCSYNLRRIGTAMFAYANDHDGKLPPDFETLLKAGKVSEKDFLCPSSSAKIGDLHACYEYIPGQTTSIVPRNVLVYEIGKPHGDEGCFVLFQDAHVEFVEPYSRALKLVEETKARLEKDKAKEKSDE